MSLENIVSKAKDRAKLQFLPASRERMRDYIGRYDLKKYFGDDVSEEDKEKFRRGLEDITNKTMDKYSTEFEGTFRKAAAKGTMGLAFLNDLYAYASQVPLANVTGLGYILFAAKSIAEIPALWRYVRKSGDMYGAIKHVLLKPIRYLIPIAGAALESGSFDRMVKKGVRKEIVREFAKRYGEYVPVEERLRKKLKEPLRDNVYLMPAQREYVNAA